MLFLRELKWYSGLLVVFISMYLPIKVVIRASVSVGDDIWQITRKLQKLGMVKRNCGRLGKVVYCMRIGKHQNLIFFVINLAFNVLLPVNDHSWLSVPLYLPLLRGKIVYNFSAPILPTIGLSRCRLSSCLEPGNQLRLATIKSRKDGILNILEKIFDWWLS